MKDAYYMKLALAQANKAIEYDDVPIGAVIVYNDKIIARAYNTKQQTNNAMHHCEMLALKKAYKKLNDWRLEGATMYVTLEPCIMCAGALINSRISRIVFGAFDPKGGGLLSNLKINTVPNLNHYPIVEGGVLKQQCSEILTTYFKNSRQGIKIVKANIKEIDEITLVIEQAKQYIKSYNSDQWQGGSPTKDELLADIKKRCLYVLKINNKIEGTMVVYSQDNLYKNLVEKDSKYLAIHRMAISDNYRHKGYSKHLFNKAFQIARNNNCSKIYIDTHELNHAMQLCLEKRNFKECGIVYLNQNNAKAKRIAYHYIVN